jgi:hypothetical protein
VSAPQPRLIALAAAGGAAALGTIGVAWFVLGRWLGGDPPASLPGAPVSTGAEVASAGMLAPGTAELRKLGCDPAIVMDAARLMGAAAIHAGEPRFIVTCDVTGPQAPTCEAAAGAYFAAVGGNAGGNVSIRVSRTGASAPLCSRLYAPSGAVLGM